MSRYQAKANANGDVVITDADGDMLVVRDSGSKSHIVLSIIAKGDHEGPAVEIKAEWLLKAILDAKGL